MQKQTEFPPPPEWVVVGESVLIRPYNTSGVICFVGPTHFHQVSIFSYLLFILQLKTLNLLKSNFFVFFSNNEKKKNREEYGAV